MANIYIIRFLLNIDIKLFLNKMAKTKVTAQKCPKSNKIVMDCSKKSAHKVSMTTNEKENSKNSKKKLPQESDQVKANIVISNCNKEEGILKFRTHNLNTNQTTWESLEYFDCVPKFNSLREYINIRLTQINGIPVSNFMKIRIYELWLDFHKKNIKELQPLE